MRTKRTALWIVLSLTTSLMVMAQPTGGEGDSNRTTRLPETIAGSNGGGASAAALLPAGANAAVIKVEGLVYGYTLTSLRRRVDEALRAGASVIVIELDTPGGLVDSALKISKFIKAMTVPTVAWINPEAYSAGIMIAAACNRLVMAPASATGDCAPIVPGLNLSPTERAKALSPILEDFRDSATINHYDYVLFRAMCELGVSVYRIENPATNQKRLVDQTDYAKLVNNVATPGSVPEHDTTSDEPPAAADAVPAAPQPKAAWRLVETIHDGTTLLTLSQRRATDVGLAQAIVRNQEQLKQFLGAASVTTISDSRVAVAAYWLTQPWVRAILTVLLLAGAYLELQAPGLGLPGLIAAAALLLLLIAPFLVGLAQVWHVVLFLIGVILIAAEILVIPGFGIAGISGIVCIFVGLVLMVVPTTGQGPLPLPPPEMAQRLRDSVLFTLLGIISSGVVFYYITKHCGSLPILRRLILSNASQHPTPGGGASPATHVSGDEAIGGGRITLGAIGKAMTTLRPTGRAQFDDDIVDVVSEGQWIKQGQAVRVIEVHGNRLVVEPDTTA